MTLVTGMIAALIALGSGPTAASVVVPSAARLAATAPAATAAAPAAIPTREDGSELRLALPVTVAAFPSGAPVLTGSDPVPAATAPTGPLTAEDIVANVQAFYEKTVDYTAEFDQTYTYKVYKRKKVSKGKVYFKKPGKMRWEYSAPEPKVFVADGSTLWVYDPGEKSVLKSKMDSSTLPTSITFLMGAGDLKSEFKAKLLKDHPLASSGIHVLELVPIKDAGHYQKLQLIVSAKSFMVLRTIVFDPTGNVNDIKFRKARIDSSVEDAIFKFEVPAGVEVIEG